IVQGIVEGTVEWATDPDFGYEIASSVPGVDVELLQPALLYQRLGREAEYQEMVARLGKERSDYLAGYTRLDPSVAAGL
ncbi:MAG: hypothetical protein ACRDU7_05505, partial [Acidimicrobiia bacterium]